MPAAVVKPVLPPLQTPKSANFPSEVSASPLPSSLSSVKQEDSMKTPITPPVAYTDFLKTLTPVLSASPRSSLHRSFSAETTTDKEASSGKSTPASEPATSTSGSFSFCRCNNHKSSPMSATTTTTTTTTTAAASAAAASPSFAHPRSARCSDRLRRLRIPPSPMVSSGNETPGSGSFSTMRSPFSPADWALDSKGQRPFETPRSACLQPVSVRSVVTRTVTYKRTPPLDPAPKGKKRKVADGSASPAS